MLTVLTPPTTSDLTIAATATRELQLLREEELAGLAELIGQASATCGAFCGRPEGFGRATVRQTERITTPRDCIILDRDLAPAITGITLDGTALAGTDWELDGALLYRLSGDARVRWERGTVAITYAAGFTLLAELPQEIERACLLVVAAIHAARGRDPMQRTENNGLVAASYLDPRPGMEAMPPAAAALLAPWRRLHI
jgi:hypothetical protein